jgi:hypothetical protein
MEFQEALFGAPATVVGYKRALPSITAPDRSSDLGRDASRAAGNPPALTWAVRRGEFLLGKVLKQCRQGTIENLAEVPIWNLMTQEGLGLPNLLMQFSVGCELHFVTLRG